MESDSTELTAQQALNIARRSSIESYNRAILQRAEAGFTSIKFQFIPIEASSSLKKRGCKITPIPLPKVDESKGCWEVSWNLE